MIANILLDRLLEQQLIVTGHAQPRRQLFADFAAAASEFTGDGNDIMGSQIGCGISSFLIFTKQCISLSAEGPVDDADQSAD